MLVVIAYQDKTCDINGTEDANLFRALDRIPIFISGVCCVLYVTKVHANFHYDLFVKTMFHSFMR